MFFQTLFLLVCFAVLLFCCLVDWLFACLVSRFHWESQSGRRQIRAIVFNDEKQKHCDQNIEKLRSRVFEKDFAQIFAPHAKIPRFTAV
jgi:hypothetical protein